MGATLMTRARARVGTRELAGGLVLALAVVGGAGCKPLPPPPPPPPDDAAPVVVFDIDGTLTDDELTETPHPGATQAVNAYVEKGYDVVYVTARWDLILRGSTESWLADNGFPDEELYMAPSLLVTEESRVEFKTDTLTDIEAAKDQVVYAYGDSSSDFDAYANVGVPASKVFALQRASASECQPGVWATCLPDYVGHLSYINAQPTVP